MTDSNSNIGTFERKKSSVLVMEFFSFDFRCLLREFVAQQYGAPDKKNYNLFFIFGIY